MSVKRLVGRFLMNSSKPVQVKAERRKARPACELFEDRVVLSHIGGMPGGGGFGRGGHRGGLPAQVGTLTPKAPPVNILGALGAIGITPVGGGFGHGFGKDGDHVPPTSSTDTTANALFSNLKTATDQLRTDSQTIAANSGLTVADLTALMNDSQTIAASGATLDATKLEAAVSILAYAVAGGTDQTQSKADFAAVFSGTGVTQATIDKTTADLVQAITDSKVTTANLDTLKADKAAVDAAQKALADAGYGPGQVKGNCPAPSSTSTTTTGSSSSSGVMVASGSTFKSATKGVMHARRAGRHH